MRVLLDTNAYSALMRGHREVAGMVRRAERILLSSVVVGELLYGFRCGNRFEENAARLDAFLDNPFVTGVPVSFATADRFGRIAVALRRRGEPIPTNDMWIAAQAMETGADLLSADTHFAAVAGLAWVAFSPTGEDTVRARTLRYHAAGGAD